MPSPREAERLRQSHSRTYAGSAEAVEVEQLRTSRSAAGSVAAAPAVADAKEEPEAERARTKRSVSGSSAAVAVTAAEAGAAAPAAPAADEVNGDEAAGKPQARAHLEDPWNLVRLALGSMASTPWRVKQALVCPQEAFVLNPGATQDGRPWSDVFRQSQTFEQFKRDMPFRPNSTKGTIDVVVLDGNQLREQVYLDEVLAHVEAFIGFRTAVKPKTNLLNEGNPKGPLDAQATLANVRLVSDPRSVCTVALTSRELFVPKDSGGQEQVTGFVDKPQRLGVYTCARYRIDAAKAGRDPKTLRSSALVLTLCREILGMCALGRCHLLECLLNPLPRQVPEAVLELPFGLCCICLRKLHWLTQRDLLDRYAWLPSVISGWFPKETVWLWGRMEQVGMPTYASLLDPRQAQRDVGRE
eukprot:TRINITY_DN38343_c0_g1_i1.p1 TRINITY_DN38343_c0_g1~~TRINITY_DN38343_c0_g1_i1.p1  ORF type:complete len:414 (-),score=104.25 TRINITY_DN38343_c0_g1_i1:115-1356(-)